MLTVLAWVPLLVLSVVEGHAWGGVALPFLHDVELHARFLLAMPLLIVAELVVHWRMRPVVRAVPRARADPGLERGRRSTPRSPRRCGSATRSWAELALIAFVYVVGVGVVWRTQIALDVSSWHGAPVDGRWQPTLAGWWLGW